MFNTINISITRHEKYETVLLLILIDPYTIIKPVAMKKKNLYHAETIFEDKNNPFSVSAGIFPNLFYNETTLIFTREVQHCILQVNVFNEESRLILSKPIISQEIPITMHHSLSKIHFLEVLFAGKRMKSFRILLVTRTV